MSESTEFQLVVDQELISFKGSLLISNVMNYRTAINKLCDQIKAQNIFQIKVSFNYLTALDSAGFAIIINFLNNLLEQHIKPTIVNQTLKIDEFAKLYYLSKFVDNLKQ